jgi:hypothetical protein
MQVLLCAYLRDFNLRLSARTSSAKLCEKFLFFFLLFPSFAPQNMVEKFELIATTGKNAKTPLIPAFQSTIIPIIC